MARVALVATLTQHESVKAAWLNGCLGWLHWRGDLLGPDFPQTLENGVRPRWLFSLRSRSDGGRSDLSKRERQRGLAAAALNSDLVELDGRQDLSPELLALIPPAKRLITWRGAPPDLTALRSLADHLRATEARYYRIVTEARRSGDELAPLLLLKALGRQDTTAYAVGKIGFWTRILAPRLGAPLAFGSLETRSDSEARPSLDQLMLDYGYPALTPIRRVCGIVGHPVLYSLFPRVLNACFRHSSEPTLYVPFHVESFQDFSRRVMPAQSWADLGFTLRGLTVVSPFKEEALAQASRRSPTAVKAASSNLLLQQRDGWFADTSDSEGIEVLIARSGVDLHRRRAAVIGCGGSGRAIAVALASAGAKITLVNRSIERGLFAQTHLGFPFQPLAGFSPEGFDLVVNATPVGRDGDRLPIDFQALSREAVVIDLAYGKVPTHLVTDAVGRGGLAIDGREVLLGHAECQFRAISGRKIPEGVARRSLGWNLDAAAPLPADFPSIGGWRSL